MRERLFGRREFMRFGLVVATGSTVALSGVVQKHDNVGYGSVTEVTNNYGLLGAVVTTLSELSTISTAEAAPLIEPIVDSALEIVNQTDPTFKTESDRQIKEIGSLVSDKLRLNRLGVKIILMDPTDSRLKVDNQRYGVFLDSLRTEGAGGMAVIKPGEQNEMLVSFIPDNQKLKRVICHEESHFLYPPFGATSVLLESSKQTEVNYLYEKFQLEYKKRISEGRYSSQYEMAIYQGVYPEIAKNGWGYFLGLIEMGQYTDFAIPRSEIEKAAVNSDNPTFKAISIEFLKDPKKEYLSSVDFVTLLSQGYYKNGESFLVGTGVAKDNYMLQFNTLLGSGEKEAWADLGYFAFENPQATKDVFPEFYESFSKVYQAISGQSLEQAAPKVRSKSNKEIINDAKYGVVDGKTREVIKKLIYQAVDPSINSYQTRTEIIASLSGMVWSDQQLTAATVELVLENTKEFNDLVHLLD
jgi:hypothetical protein